MNHSTHGRSPKRGVMAWTIALWAFGTATYAYIYITPGVALPDAVGYEADWSRQLFSSPSFASRFSYWYLVRSSTLSTCCGRARGRPTMPPN
jgi:hypothetical protein